MSAIISGAAVAIITAFVIHKFTVWRGNTDRIRILVSWLDVVRQELSDAEEKFKNKLSNVQKEILYVNDSGYEGLKSNGLVDLLPPDVHRQIYLIYQTFWSINHAADLKNQFLASNVEKSQTFNSIILAYYQLGLNDINLLMPSLESITSEFRRQLTVWFWIEKDILSIKRFFLSLKGIWE